MRIVCLFLALTLAGCKSSGDRAAAAERPRTAAIPASVVEILRRQKTFALLENRDLPPGTPDPGLVPAARAILHAAGLKEDPASGFRVQINWRGQAVPHDYRSYVGGRSMLNRYTGAVVSGMIVLSEQGRQFYRKDFSVSVRPMLDFQFQHEEHMKNPSEAPFRSGVFAYETPGEGPVAALARTIGSAFGEPVVRWAISQPDSSLKYAGAEMAGEQKLASLRSILEQLARHQTMFFPEPAHAAAQALGQLPRDPGTIALLKGIARSHSTAWVAAFGSLVDLRLEEQTPELIEIMTSARLLLDVEGMRLLEQARLACSAACKQPLVAHRAKITERMNQIEKGAEQSPIYRSQRGRRVITELDVLKEHRDIVDAILLRLAKAGT